MPGAALRLVSLLRKVPRTVRFDRHLDDCMTLGVVTNLGEDLPSLRVAHVLGLIPVPRLCPCRARPVIKRTATPGS
jgi:hypothetical protein